MESVARKRALREVVLARRKSPLEMALLVYGESHTIKESSTTASKTAQPTTPLAPFYSSGAKPSGAVR